MKRTIFVLGASLLLATAGGCGDDAPQGGLGQDCYPNDSCDADLVCVDGTCEDPAD